MKFDRAKAETQAVKAISLIQSAKLISSVGTNRNYKDCLTHVAQYIKDNRLGDLRQCSIQTAERFLQDKASEYSQKTLDMHRQALQSFLTARGDLASTDKLTIVESQISTVLSHRAYGRGMQKRNFDSELKSLNDRPSNQASICKATSSPKLNGVF